MPAPQRLVIATRESALALWQAHHIRDRLASLYPQCRIELLGMTTQGDKILDRPLAAIGGKGLFIKELEVAMAENHADLAVHSLKDVPMIMPDGFTLAAITQREDPRDAFVSNRYRTLAELPPGAVVGTSSLRREAQLRARYPQIVIEPLRGNVGTRLRKLDDGQYDAIILAAAGLKRLGEGARITGLLDPADSLPAPGQGALGIECRADRADVQAALAPLHDLTTAACVAAERAFSRALGGSCHTPLGGYAQLQGERLHLAGVLASRDGVRILRADIGGPMQNAEALGTALAVRLREQGADALLAEL